MDADASRVTAGAAELLAWYARVARDLPWRRTRDPYAIWVSEIMLQQTQVQTVIPYWERWMRTFPDVAALARADEARVLKHWEGLGYYRRARHLHAAARFIQEHHGGVFPRNSEDVLALPGVGRYTAGAIRSIAFHEPAPLLDGNVIRVLTRFEAREGDPAKPALNRVLWEFAERWVVAGRGLQGPIGCSHLNQALMELGALVCTPTSPRCEECPLANACRARITGAPENFPTLRARPKVTPRSFVVILVRRGDHTAVRQRPADGVNGGLWEFPNREIAIDEDPAVVAARVARELGFVAAAAHLRPVGSVRHALTRYRVTQHVFRLAEPERASGAARSRSRVRTADTTHGAEAWTWHPVAALGRLAWSSAHRRMTQWA